jgi:hypothetical protein
MYVITDYTKSQANKLGVVVKPSSKKGKKIDVYKKGYKVASIGDVRYSDYPHYIKSDGKTVALKHREAYRTRHKKDMSVVGSPGFFSGRLLW